MDRMDLAYSRLFHRAMYIGKGLMHGQDGLGLIHGHDTL